MKSLTAPGRGKGQRLTYRQLGPVFHEAAAAAGATKRVSVRSLCHYPNMVCITPLVVLDQKATSPYP
jgi:hypothetical protein